MLCALGALGTGGVAQAHQADPNVFTEIDRVTPALPRGVSVTLEASAAELVVLTNTTRRTYEVLGAGGRPFLRIGPRGAQGDLAAPDWYLNNDPTGAVALPAGVSSKSTPRWRTVSREPSWSWFDRRVQPAPLDARKIGSRDVLALGGFAVPLRSGDVTSVVRGHSEWRRTTGAIVAALESATPAWTGVRLTVLPGQAPALYIDSATTRPVTVLGDKGEPFARVDPSGVSINRRSPTYVYGVVAAGGRPALAADASAPPVWKRVADVPRYGWVDPRLSQGLARAPAEPDRRATLRAWTIPLEVGARRALVRGTTSWQPVRGGEAIAAPPPPSAAGGGGGHGSTAWTIALGGLLLGGLCLLLTLVVRPRERSA